MTLEQINMATLSELEQRKKDIANLIKNDDSCDLDALENEVEQINERCSQIKDQIEKRSKLLNDVMTNGTTVREFGRNPSPAAGEPIENRSYDASSAEYRSAWLKTMAVDNNGKKLFGELSEVEKRAFTFTTENSGAVVPTEILDRIVSLVDSEAPIYSDSTKSQMIKGFSVVRAKAPTAGKAKKTAEGTANEDTQQELENIDLTGVEIKKTVKITKKMEFQSIDAFETWLVTNIADEIRLAKEEVCVEALNDSKKGIQASNILTGTELNDAEIRKVFAKLKGKKGGKKVLYANSETIWNTLAGLENSNGEKLFISSPQNDPTVEGVIYGAQVKEDDSIPVDTIIVGYPKRLLANDFVEIEIHLQTETGTLNKIFVGYSLFDAGLEDPRAFAKWSKS